MAAAVSQPHEFSSSFAGKADQIEAIACSAQPPPKAACRVEHPHGTARVAAGGKQTPITATRAAEERQPTSGPEPREQRALIATYP